jgi:hypothetical protein
MKLSEELQQLNDCGDVGQKKAHLFRVGQRYCWSIKINISHKGD